VRCVMPAIVPQAGRGRLLQPPTPAWKTATTRRRRAGGARRRTSRTERAARCAGTWRASEGFPGAAR